MSVHFVAKLPVLGFDEYKVVLVFNCIMNACQNHEEPQTSCHSRG